MLDHLHIHIPFKRSSKLLKGFRRAVFASDLAKLEQSNLTNLTKASRNQLLAEHEHKFIYYCVDEVMLSVLGVKLVGQISYDEDGLTCVDDLSCRWESMPTSFTPLAFKVETKSTDLVPVPGIILKGSPAKVVQGHNVYGSSSIELGFNAFIKQLESVYPELLAHLDLANTKVYGIDVTYSARFANEQMLLNMMESMRGVSSGQTKARGSSYQNSIYWGSKLTQTKAIKIYNKYPEVLSQIKKCKKRGSGLGHIVSVLEDQLEHARCLLRCEVTLKGRYLKGLDIPTNINRLIRYQNKQAKRGQDLLFDLWSRATAELFKAFADDKLRIDVCDDEAVRDELIAKHRTFNKYGRALDSKVNRLFNFYRSLRDYGYEDLKKNTSSSFYRNFKELMESGFSRATLQQLRNLKNGFTKRQLKFEQLEFNDQFPEDYQEPNLRDYLVVRSPADLSKSNQDLNQECLSQISRKSTKQILVTVEGFKVLQNALEDKAQVFKLIKPQANFNLRMIKVPSITGDLYLADEQIASG